MKTPESELDPVIGMMCAAWESLREQMEEDGSRWKSAVESPAAQVSEAAGASARREVADEALALTVRAVLEAQVRMQWLTKLGMVSPQAMTGIVQTVAGFAGAAVQGAEASCTGLECDWRGSVADMGPSARCVKCGSAAKPVPKLSLVNGRGEVLR